MIRQPILGQVRFYLPFPKVGAVSCQCGVDQGGRRRRKILGQISSRRPLYCAQLNRHHAHGTAFVKRPSVYFLSWERLAL